MLEYWMYSRKSDSFGSNNCWCDRPAYLHALFTPARKRTDSFYHLFMVYISSAELKQISEPGPLTLDGTPLLLALNLQEMS